MKKIYTLLICLLCSLGAQAQALRGTVLDSLTRKPIQGVSVYLDGTSIYTVTDAQGRFELSTEKKVNTSVVFSHIGYRMRSFPYPYTGLGNELLMAERVQAVEEVIVRHNLFTREEMLEAFRTHFLGETRAGKRCEIQNEESIDLWYDIDDLSLNASSREPLHISNPYLGYELRYEMERFRVTHNILPESGPAARSRTPKEEESGKKKKKEEKKYTIDVKEAAHFLIEGTVYFTDLKPDSKAILRHRNYVYGRSSISFLKELTQGKVGAAYDRKGDFKLYDYDYYNHTADSLFSITDSLHMKLVKLRPRKSLENMQQEFDRKVYSFCRVVYKDVSLSGIIFFEPEFLVDDYGNFSKEAGLFFLGDMAKQRVGDILPQNYTP